MPLQDNYFDCVISNGAFCLAQNKQKAFEEIFRVLKNNGRISICTSVVKNNLEGDISWPICMKMFINIQKIKPMLEEIGFKNIIIDDSNSLMQFNIDVQ